MAVKPHAQTHRPLPRASSQIAYKHTYTTHTDIYTNWAGQWEAQINNFLDYNEQSEASSIFGRKKSCHTISVYYKPAALLSRIHSLFLVMASCREHAHPTHEREHTKRLAFFTPQRQWQSARRCSRTQLAMASSMHCIYGNRLLLCHVLNK